MPFPGPTARPINRMRKFLPGFFAPLAAVALLAGAQFSVSAQTPANATAPARVTFFTEPNFLGEALTVEAGASVSSLDSFERANRQPWTGAISSVRVEGPAKAILYTARGFSGDKLELSASVSDLYGEPRGANGFANWDRCVASVAVTGPRIVTLPSPQPQIVYPPRNEQPPTTVIVTPQPASPPRPVYDLRTADALIHRAYREVLAREADFEGIQRYRQKLIREGWDERQLYEALQRSSEARAINPEAAITKIFRETLGRDPDPAGLAHYRKLWRDGWTQGQIRDDLRRSPESRDFSIRSAITRAYRELLNRAPDPAGFATYEKLMREKGMAERQLRESLMQSDEYRQLHPRR